MRTSIIASLVAFAATLVSAQDPYWNITSKPFALVLLSKNQTLNGSSLYACHEGAAIEGLCVADKVRNPSSTSREFRFNTTVYNQEVSGLLVWNLNAGTSVYSSPMELSYNPISNVAIPLFRPAYYGTLVRFDKNKLTVQGHSDDTVVPENRHKLKDYYRWYTCQTYYGYSYHTLAWSVGQAKPQNPTCQKVDVVRVF